MKQSKDKLHKRDIAPEKGEEYKARIEELDSDIKRVFKMESCEKELRRAEMAAAKAENMLKFEEEIYNKPKK